ncbi:hypothetical protein RRG08_011382 [Elysia crispata]|uniref:Uncharacterized protein n=1 Tax=Elysia crispata TaxID=231223 RepID=A0AAE0ZMX5_9GAST|nr:hypothetical protein RRG08_011382 [Elysia crispata]
MDFYVSQTDLSPLCKYCMYSRRQNSLMLFLGGLMVALAVDEVSLQKGSGLERSWLGGHSSKAVGIELNLAMAVGHYPGNPTPLNSL